jgi:hypothetical protein
VTLEGLHGGTRVEEVLRQGAEALGVGAGVKTALVCEGRLLREDATLWEAGVRAEGVVELRVGEAGGMPGAEAVSIFASIFAREEEAAGSDEELVGAVGQLANYVEGIEGAVWRLEAARQAIEGADPPAALRTPAGQEHSPAADRLHMVQLDFFIGRLLVSFLGGGRVTVLFGAAGGHRRGGDGEEAAPSGRQGGSSGSRRQELRGSEGRRES